MRPPISLRQMEAFRAVATTLSFSVAARQVHLSQPALSTAIRKLEDLLEASLFDRSTRHVTLTPVGRELLAAVESVFGNVDAALGNVADFVAGKRGRLSVAATPSLAAAFLPEVVAAFEARHPGIGLQVHDVLSDQAIAMVSEGRADLALAPQSAADDTLTQTPLFEDTLMLLCRSDHPLAAARSTTWRKVLPHRMIGVKGNSSVRQLLDAAYLEQGVPLRPAFEVENASTVIGFVANGLGVGVLPLSLLPLVRVGQVTYRRITQPELHRTICLITARGRAPSPSAQAFVELCVGTAANRSPKPQQRPGPGAA